MVTEEPFGPPIIINQPGSHHYNDSYTLDALKRGLNKFDQISCVSNPTCLLVNALIHHNENANDDASNEDKPKQCPAKGKVKNPPDKGPPNGYVEGPRRGREYNPDGTPKRDYDKPHQGADYPHVHEWPNGNRAEPGRPYSPIPKTE